MKWLVLALVLFADPAWGACHVFSFDDRPAAFAPVGTVTDEDLTAKFNLNWRTSFDRDDHPEAVPDSMGQTDFWFSLAGEHGNVVCRYSCQVDENGSDDLVVDFGEPVVKSVSFLYCSGWTYCRCFDPACEYLLCQAGAVAPGSNARVELTHRADNADEYPFMGGRTYLTETGYAGDVGYGGDPNGVYRLWNVATVTAVTPCRYLHVKVACLGGGFFLDELRVCTSPLGLVPVKSTTWGQVKVLYR